MRHPLEVQLAYVEVILQDELYSFLVDAQHLCNLLLGEISLRSISGRGGED
jgi:hypothetical protein